MLSPIDLAIEYILKTTFLPYQLNWLGDKSRFKIYLKSRQIGISETIAFEALLNVLYKNENQYFVSASQRQSIELLDKFSNWLNVFKDAGIKLDIINQSRTEVRVNGCDVKSLTSNSATGQGFTGSVYLDEFALYANDQELYDSLLPSILLGGSLKVVSRPMGQNNLFHKIWEGLSYKNYSFHKTDIHEAVKQGLSVNIQELQDSMDLDSFAEQFETNFIDSKTSFFPYELLRTCTGEPDKNIKGKTYITVDVGRSNDRTAICVFAEDENKVYQMVEVEELHKTEFSDQEQIISDYINKYIPLKVAIDKGFNPQLTETLEKKFKGTVIGLHCGDDLKHKCFSGLKKMFEDKKIMIPAFDDVISQLHSVKREATAGKTKYTAPRNARGHSDIAFSMMMLIELTGNTRNPRIIIPKW